MIVNFAYPSSPQYTGGVVALYEFANALARRGHEVHFIHGPASPHRIDHVGQLSWFAFEPTVAHHLADRLDDPDLPAADIVFATDVPSRLGLPAVFVQGHAMLDLAWERAAYRARCPKVCIARWLVELGMERFGVPIEQLWHVPHGIDHDLFRTPDPVAERPIDVAVLYNAHPAKAWNIGREALELVRAQRPDLRVQVFGVLPPPFPLPEWLPFHRGDDRERLVAEVYGRAKVFLQPSWFEGFGFTAVEAMASGCALVTTDNGGSQDYATPGRTALLAPPGDAEALAAHVLALLDDDDTRRRLAGAGAERVERFTWDRTGEILEHHLEAYLAEPARYGEMPGPDPSAAAASPVADGPPERFVPPRGPIEEDVVFNVVWTGTVFTHLQHFVTSQIAHSRARYRFVANGCPPAQVELMEAYRRRVPDRVIEVLDVSPDAMIAHGVVLDRLRAQRDDGPFFALIDPDIKANSPFLGEFLDLLADHDAVTSGKEVWSDDNLVPMEHPGVAGEHFFDRQGFVFGSPHLAIYRRAALDATCERWRVGQGSAGPEMSDAARARMADLGHEYLVYDTSKIVNALLQADGHRLVHRDLPQLVHIGGLAHFLSPPAYRTNEQGEEEPDWTVYESMATRHAVTRFTAKTLQAIATGDEPPTPPIHIDDTSRAKLELVHREVVDLMARYSPSRPPVVAEPSAWPKRARRVATWWSARSR